MSKRIIYKNEDGSIAIITPFLGCGLTVEEIAAKDVPAGKPYKIIDASESPTDRANWFVGSADLTDGVGADYGAGSRNVVIGYEADGTPVTVYRADPHEHEYTPEP